MPPDAALTERERRIAELTGRLPILDRRLETTGQELDEEEETETRKQIKASLKRLGEEKTQVVKELKVLKFESMTGRGESVAETGSLIEMLDDVRGTPEEESVRRQLKAAIRWVVEEIWVLVQPIHQRAALAHVQVYLRGGSSRYLQILPAGKYARLPQGFAAWNLETCDFRAGGTSGPSADVGHVTDEARAPSHVAG
jgi:hypothetical protein